jgi:hypothetical protein
MNKRIGYREVWGDPQSDELWRACGESLDCRHERLNRRMLLLAILMSTLAAFGLGFLVGLSL